MDETRVTTRHKRKLEKIRGEAREDSGRHSEASSGSIQATQGSSGGDVGSLQGTYGVDGAGTQGMEGGAGTYGGSDQGIRSVDSEDQLATESVDPSYGEAREGKLTASLSPEEKASRERELHRQRQERYRKRQQEAISSSETVTSRHILSDATSATNDATNDGYVTPNDVRFQLKNPFSVKKEPEKVKLFTKSEADESVEAIAKVLMAGSSILDDILEIVVKDHVPVQIWEMDEDEATLFAQAHLKRAQKEPDAARVARKLIQIHDKLLTFKYLLSRSKATVTHIKEHGGFSFR